MPLCALLALAALPAQAGVELGVAPATRKLLPVDALPEQTSASVQAARGEWEGFQVALLSDADLSDLDASLSDLQSADGATISGASARIYRQWYLDIQQPSPLGVTYHEREPGLYPDPLIPLQDPYGSGEDVGEALSLDAGELGALFVDLQVPADAPYGSYQGQLSLSSAGQELAQVAVELQVWDIDIPAQRSIATSFGFSDNAVRYYHGGKGEEAAEGFEEIERRYLQALHEHRIDRTHVDGEVDFEFDEHGQLLEVDWSAYDAAVGPLADGSYFDDGIPVQRFNVSRFRPGGGLGDFSEEEYAQAAAAFAEHLQEMGWWEQAYVYSTDEPWLNGGDQTYEQIHEDVQRLVQASSLWEGKPLITGPYDARLDGDIGIWCPVTPMYDSWFWGPSTCAQLDGACPGWEVYEERRSQGEELWFYVCNANYPPYAGYDIDSAIGYEPRIVKWGAWYEGATGFLFWRSNYWVNDDPWNHWANWDYFGALFSRNGDGFVFYPGDHDGTAGGLGSPEGVAIDGPVVSYRLKQIRDGLEDWELLLLLEELGGGDYAREQTERIYSRFGANFIEDCDDPDHYCPDEQPWTLDETLLLQARANVAAKILYLQDPEKWPDPEADTGDDAQTEEGCACAAQGRAGGLGLLLLLAWGMGALRRRQTHSTS